MKETRSENVENSKYLDKYFVKQTYKLSIIYQRETSSKFMFIFLLQCFDHIYK